MFKGHILVNLSTYLILISQNQQCFRCFTLILASLIFEPRHDKTNNVAVCQAKTQISLGIRPV